MISDILETKEADQIRIRLDSLVDQYKRDLDKSLINEIIFLTDKLERHVKALRKSMLIPVK